MYNLLKKDRDNLYYDTRKNKNRRITWLYMDIDEPVTPSAEVSTSRCLQVTKTPPSSPCRNTTSIFVAA